MLCEKCGTENNEDTAYCKKCGEDLVANGEENAKEATSEKSPVATIVKEEERVRTSPLAVRMKEKSLKEDKKIRKKLKRGKVWATFAIIFALLFIAENAFIISGKLGFFGEKKEPAEVSEDIAPATTVPEKEIVLGTDTLAGGWTYTYNLKKNWDMDSSGDYETVTQTISSNGKAAIIDDGENHMTLVVLPGEMITDSQSTNPGTTAESFVGWYESGYICFQMKGTEEMFFAPGGQELLVVRIPVSMDENGNITSSAYSNSYTKTVTDMNMRYDIEITLAKN